MPCVIFRQCQIRDTCYFNTSFWWLMKVLFNLIFIFFLFEKIKWCGNNTQDPFSTTLYVKHIVAKVSYSYALPEMKWEFLRAQLLKCPPYFVVAAATKCINIPGPATVQKVTNVCTLQYIWDYLNQVIIYLTSCTYV